MARTPDWSRLCKEADAALRRRLAAERALSPEDVARTVAGALPKPLGDRLLRYLMACGWLAPDATVPFDVLTSPACPNELAGPWREVVRLALFGVPGQGIPYRDKHRQDVYQQLCSQIMSSAVDTESLRGIVQRVMNHPDVQADSLLASMLRSFIAQREAALRAERATPAEQHARREQRSKLRRAFDSAPRCDYPSREELLASFGRLLADFDRHLAQFEETRAAAVLEKIRELRRRFPIHIPAGDLQRCEEQMDRLLHRAGTYRRQIEELAERGAQAARAGDEQTSAWVMRRLEAIHSLLPNLLPQDRLEALRAEIHRGGQEHETREAAAEFTARQQEVLLKVKNLAGIVYRFHQLAEKLPPTDNAYRRAELNYRQALAEIRKLDTEWLTGLVLHLEALLDDLDDPTGQMQNQLDTFIVNVRTALNRLCLEIRARQSRGTPPAGPPSRPESPPPADLPPGTPP